MFSKSSLIAQLIGLVLGLAALTALAQDDGSGYPSVVPVVQSAPPPLMMAQATIPQSPPATHQPAVQRIDLESIPDPVKGNICTYRLKQGVKEETVTSRVVSIRPGHSYSVEWSTYYPDITAMAYLRGGNPWDDGQARFRSLFRYPATVGLEWQVLARSQRANGGHLTQTLKAKVIEIGSREISGSSRPVRVLGVRLDGHYAYYGPGDNVLYGTGGMWEEIVLAPDIHCLVSYRGSILKWNGSNSLRWELTLVSYDPGL